MRRDLPLSRQILLVQFGIVLATLAFGAVASLRVTEGQLRDRYGAQTKAVAESVAALPSVRDAFDDPNPSEALQPLAEGIRKATGVEFVVIANKDQIRYSHPNPDNIGKKLSTDPSPALESGTTWIGTEKGTLGRSVRAKAPIFDESGQVIGVVSVGILEEKLSEQLRGQLPRILTYALIALALGTAGSVLLARRVKRQTFNLEPREIAGLYEQREAMLHGIREGAVGVDRDGRINLMNDEAQRLLALPDGAVGRHVDDVLPPGGPRDLLAGRAAGGDAVLVAGTRVLVANRMPVFVRGTEVGSVVTLRDRTELESLLRELDTVRGVAEALRAQAHEFTNRLHTVAGLIELGRHEEAIRFVTNARISHEQLSDLVGGNVADPTVEALLLAKAALAAERGVELRLSDDSQLDEPLDDPNDVITVLGNLIDNALDAVTGAGHSGLVVVAIAADRGGLRIEVSDSGPGIPPDAVERVFDDGYTTKPGHDGMRRGLGLAIVRDAVNRRGGWVQARNDDGAVITAYLPTVAGTAAVRS
jgi:two-component system CitB family sensor kinase